MITKDEKKYFEWLKSQYIPCIVCSALEVETKSMIEFHHIKEFSSDRKNHKEVIPLCADHHKYNLEISAHSNKKAFFEMFPMESQKKIAEKIHNQFLSEMETLLED